MNYAQNLVGAGMELIMTGTGGYRIYYAQILFPNSTDPFFCHVRHTGVSLGLNNINKPHNSLLCPTRRCARAYHFTSSQSLSVSQTAR